ncbi:hypothetical protein V8D89_000104 [Ganoderma adspersum]
MLSRAWVTLSSVLFPWSYFPSCQSQAAVARPSDPEAPPPRKRPKHVATTDLTPLPRLQPIETVNGDVFRLIADELHAEGGSLHNFSLASHSLRRLALPALFSHCKFDIRNSTQALYLPPPGDAPESIRPFTRQLKSMGPFHMPRDVKRFEDAVGYLPALSSVTFKWTLGVLPWEVVKACLMNPRILSMTLDAGTIDLMEDLTYPLDDVTSGSLRRFTFTSTMWREYQYHPSSTRHRPRRKDLQEVYTCEEGCLRAILLSIRGTATSLKLPLESTPILDMGRVSWPRLRELSLHGRFRNMAHVQSLRELLPGLASLETLSIQAARTKELRRPAILPTTAPSPDHPPLFPALRSLTIAYPNPEDGIFSLDSTSLTHLSIRDCPRFYNMYAYGGWVAPEWYTPILTPKQCLSILKRMDLAALTGLELVYMSPVVSADNELLAHLAQAYPHLAHLEIHRYRLNRRDRVPYLHIARTLATIPSLRSVRLNLDFEDDHQAYCGSPQRRKVWYDKLTETKGPEIVDIMQTCPLLEHVALLYHGHPSSTWLEFPTPRFPGRKVIVKYDSEHVDSEMLPKKWQAT